MGATDRRRYKRRSSGLPAKCLLPTDNIGDQFSVNAQKPSYTSRSGAILPFFLPLRRIGIKLPNIMCHQTNGFQSIYLRFIAYINKKTVYQYYDTIKPQSCQPVRSRCDIQDCKKMLKYEHLYQVCLLLGKGKHCSPPHFV